MNTLLDTVRDRHADWTYISIGPAHSAEQQYPPFFRELPGTKLCILIDPRLEEPPLCNVDKDPTATFVEIREYFDYNEETLHGLCEYAISSRTKLIIQAFTGEDLRHRYPFQRYGTPLLDYVLYDFMYGEGSCSVDFSKVHLLLNPDGTFLQPLYSPMSAFATHKELLLTELEARYLVIYHYVNKLYEVQKGRKEAKDWFSPDIIHRRTGSLCIAYNVPHNTETDSLLLLQTSVFEDLCHVVGDGTSLSEIIALIDKPDNAYISALQLLRSILKEENSAPQ